MISKYFLEEAHNKLVLFPLKLAKHVFGRSNRYPKYNK